MAWAPFFLAGAAAASGFPFDCDLESALPFLPAIFGERLRGGWTFALLSLRRGNGDDGQAENPTWMRKNPFYLLAGKMQRSKGMENTFLGLDYSFFSLSLRCRSNSVCDFPCQVASINVWYVGVGISSFTLPTYLPHLPVHAARRRTNPRALKQRDCQRLVSFALRLTCCALLD